MISRLISIFIAYHIKYDNKQDMAAGPVPDRGLLPSSLGSGGRGAASRACVLHVCVYLIDMCICVHIHIYIYIYV